VRAAARETGAALAALCVYVTTVLPRVRKELRRWRRMAEAIPDPERRRRVLAALKEKQSNVEAVAVFAILAPLRQRRAVLRAIVPLQLAIDYRDVLEEAGEDTQPDSFLTALDCAWVREIERLAGCGSVAPTLRAAVERCAEGQRRTHAAAGDHSAELERWASALDPSSEYRWWELAAGASSSVAAHALIAAAADPAASAGTAALVDAAYNPSVGALTVFLDDLVDLEADAAAGEHDYLGYYEMPTDAAERLAWIAEQAGDRIEALPRPARHRAILAGVGAFYLGGAQAVGPYAPVRERLLAALGPGTQVLTVFVRARRRRNADGPGKRGAHPDRETA
jgi:tetraprenyl-beta-curcumene synthase